MVNSTVAIAIDRPRPCRAQAGRGTERGSNGPSSLLFSLCSPAIAFTRQTQMEAGVQRAWVMWPANVSLPGSRAGQRRVKMDQSRVGDR